ncbi:MAG: FAD-dependent oxidoreductase [Eggerthella sp.]|nr:FAD-binding protein [Eggerthella sp.]MDU1389034.1 FAD-dependent oxidoreductase [Eggerthella sp.]
MNQSDKNTLSRRSFLTGAAATAGLAAFAGLAGCAPQSTTGGAANAATASGASASGSASAGAMQTTDPAQAVWPVVEEVEVGAAGEGKIAFVAEPIAASDIVATHDVDVVVCGLGPAGDAAALACAEQGLKTVAVEKQTTGNYNSATIGGTNSKLHKHWGMSYDTDAWISDAMIDCAFQGDMELYRHWLEKNGEAVDWYISHFDNQNLDDYPLTFAAGDFPDFRDEWDKTSLSRSWNTSLNLPYPAGELAGILAGILEQAGVEIRYSCPACQLVADGSGKVTGVIVQSDQGFEQYNCAKGVVLATGGYEFNQQMLKERCRPRGVPGSWLTGAFGNTGDGHQMGLAVGAAEDEFPHAIMLDPEQLMPYLRVNKLGKRFTPEYEPYGHLALAIQAQPGTYDFYVVDSAIGEKIDKIWTPSSSCYGPKEVWTAAATSEHALKADTLEELAKLMEVPEDQFVATIERWNEMAATGKDEDFGKPANYLVPVDTPPFYGIHRHVRMSAICSGVDVNAKHECLTPEGEVIENLYAIGNCSGHFYGGIDYPLTVFGLSLGRCYTEGYVIGRMVAEK